MNFKTGRYAMGGCLLAGMLGATAAYANSTTYYLDDANWKSLLPDDITPGYYASVTVDDNGAAGLINFTVAVNPAYVTAGTGSYGIDTFAFNVSDPALLADLNDCNLTGPDTCNDPGDSFLNLNSAWKADVVPPDNNTVASFGNFDVRLSDSNMPLGPLTFSIDSSLDTFLSYASASHGTPLGGDLNSLFAVHVRGITTGLYFDGTGACAPGSTGCSEVTSAWFGSEVVVPVPAAVWLFGSGLLGLVGVARRKRNKI